MSYSLTPEELSIQQHLDAMISSHPHLLGDGQHDQILHFTKLAQQQVEHTKKTKQVTIRMNETDLVALKAKALKLGMPYQTLMGVKLREFARS